MSVAKRLSALAGAILIACFVGCTKSAHEAQSAPAFERTTAPALSAVAPRAQIPLIAREILFGNPDKASPRISPDGTRIAYLAPADGVLNVWVGPADNPSAAKAVTSDKKRGIRQYHWAYDNKHILYLQDEGGDENWHVYAVDLASGATKDLTPLKKVAAQIDGISHKVPGEILVGLNDRNEQLHDVYRVNIETGERKLVLENPGFVSTVSDDDLRVRIGVKFGADGMTMLRYEPGDKDNPWKELAKVDMQDAMTTQPMGFDKEGTKLYLLDSRERNTSALKVLDLATGMASTLAENDQSDIADVMIHPTEKTVDAVAFTRARKQWQPLDSATGEDLNFLSTVADGDVEVTSRTLDDKKWTVVYVLDDGPVQYYLYDRENHKATFLFTNRKSLEGQPLVKMYPVSIRARDGLELVSYLSIPASADRDHDARPDRPLPMVLLVHGGPWARDDWGFDPLHQLLANRGYAVLSVNYRGSTGFGKAFVNAGNKEWAGKMHDDLIDAVNWAVAQRIADRERVAIAGGSYGGYSTLVGLTFTPETFACGVDIVGPSNLVTLLNNIPPYWAPMLPVLTDRVGDPSTPEGQKFLTSRSPLSRADRIKRPLLIGQGANDPRVKKAEAEQIVNAMREKNIPVTYVLFPDEGHGFARPENNLAFFAVAEAFLAQNLGGRFETIGKAFDGSTITVPEGEAGVPGLKEAMAAMPKPAESAKAPDATEAPKEPAQPETPKQPDAQEPPKQPDASDAPKKPDAADAPKPPDAQEAPKTPDAPK
jgi:dipeptidyl aminopeptidase/acylaminoacyl peptidase